MASKWIRVATLAIAGASILVGPAAEAATVTVDDRRDDVWSSSNGEDDFADTGTTRVNVDVVRTSVTHAGRQVRATVRLADLARNEDMRQVGVGFKGSNGRTTHVFWFADESMPRGAHFIMRRSGDEVRCRGLRHSVDYARDVVRFTVPRSCLGRPKTVQFQAFAVAGETSTETFFIDDARSAEAYPTTWSRRIRRG